MLLTLASVVFMLVFLVWSSTCAYLFVEKLHGGPVNTTVNAIWKLLKWPALLGVLLQPVAAYYLEGPNNGFEWFCFALFLFFWLLFRNQGDDDEWKKTRRKALAKVQQIANRLEVVPA